jgi:hypothetical protein
MEVNHMFNPVITGAVQGAIVGIICQTKITEMTFVGAGVAFVKCLLGPIIANRVGSEFDTLADANKAEVTKFFRKLQLKILAVHLIDTVIFIIAARKLGVFGTRGTSIYLGLGILSSLKHAEFI